MTQPDLPDPPDNSEVNVDGILDPREVLYLENIQLVNEVGPIFAHAGDAETDQMAAFLRDSFVWMMTVYEPATNANKTVTIAMPQEAILWIITQAMARMQEMPPADPGSGLIIP